MTPSPPMAGYCPACADCAAPLQEGEVIAEHRARGCLLPSKIDALLADLQAVRELLSDFIVAMKKHERVYDPYCTMWVAGGVTGKKLTAIRKKAEAALARSQSRSEDTPAPDAKGGR